MSAQQVQRLQALLTTVQANRKSPRAVAVAAAPAMRAPAAPAASFDEMEMMEEDFGEPVAAPIPAPVMAQPAARPAPVQERRAPIVEEVVRVPDRMSSPRQPQVQPMRASEPKAAPAPARPTSPGATPLEMALEGEVARAANAAGGRVLADPTPFEPTRAIAQAVSKHPPTTGQTFGELLRRSLSLRAR